MPSRSRCTRSNRELGEHRHCGGQGPPSWAVKRPSRPCKRAIERGFPGGNANANSPRRPTKQGTGVMNGVKGCVHAPWPRRAAATPAACYWPVPPRGTPPAWVRQQRASWSSQGAALACQASPRTPQSRKSLQIWVARCTSRLRAPGPQTPARFPLSRTRPKASFYSWGQPALLV